MTNSISGSSRNRGDILSDQSSKTSKTENTSASGVKNIASSKSNADTVNITSEASKIRELQSSLANTPDIDLAKVESIKNEIANGNYPIDHERIASNLIDLEKALS
ncbi:MAG: flagellar biosynthesis anti-sigma factor FlgM [Gammaproteobacteria bacterium]|nr:flagellar biosynthesis anti-sigma factor FlgM [Gammaproteobacteria bacterium]